MDEMTKHILERLTEVEAELQSLREVTWPVCQGLLDKDCQFSNKIEKKKFFRFLYVEEVINLLKRKARFMEKSPDLAAAELQWVLVESPPEGAA